MSIVCSVTVSLAVLHFLAPALTSLNLGVALAVLYDCNCLPSASEVIRHTCAIQIRLLLLLLLLLLNSSSSEIVCLSPDHQQF